MWLLLLSQAGSSLGLVDAVAEPVDDEDADGLDEGCDVLYQHNMSVYSMHL